MSRDSIRRAVSWSVAASCFLLAVVSSFADSISYTYDDLNRLTKTQYGSGTVIEYTYDEVGNRTQKKITDTITPVTTASPVGGAYNATKTVTLTCSDGTGSGCSKIYYTTNGTTPTTASSVYATALTVAATTTLKYFATDLAGNSEAVKTQTYTIETAAPVTTAAPLGGPYNTAKTVTLSCSDGTGSGCSKIYYTINGTTPTTASSVYASVLTIAATTTLKYFATDLAGNSEALKTQTYTIETTAPVTTAAPLGGPYNTAKTVTLSCSDGTGSGCSKIYYTTNGTTPTTASSVYATALTVAATTTLKYFATDLAGNSEAVKTQTYTIDTTVPTGTIAINAGAAATNATSATLNLTCSDANGCSQMQLSNDNITWNAAEAYVVSKPWTLTAGAGTKTVYVKYKDAAGNWTAALSDTIALDTTLPTGTIAINAGAAATNVTSSTLNLTCSDANGCSQMQLSNDNITWNAAETYVVSKPWTLTAGAGTKTVYVKYKDAAGNWTAALSDTIALDTTAPTGTIAINAGAAATNVTSATLNLTCSDANGCSQMQLSNDNITWNAAEAYAATKAWTLTAGAGTKTVYVKYKDAAGNWTAALSDTIALDTTLPTGTIAINAGAAATNVTSSTLNLTCSDANGCSQMQLSNDNITWNAAETYVVSKPWTLTAGAGTKTVYVKYKDAAGNWTAALSDTIALDTTVPTGTIAINAGAAATNATSATLNLTCSDANGCSQMQLSNDNITWNAAEAYVVSKPWTLTAGAGTKTVYVKYKDAAGNWTAALSDTIALDTTLPTGTIAINAGAAATNVTSATLNLTCSDANGCSQMQLSNDNITWNAAEAYVASKAWPLTAGAGTKTVYIKFKDSAGNWTAALSDTIVLDLTAPTGTIAINAGAAATNVTAATLTLTCSDANGCSQMQLSNDNITWNAAEAYVASKAWPLTAGAGTKTVYIKFKDSAGNWTAALSDTIALDTTLPTGTIAINAGAATTNITAATLALTCSDANGCSQMQLSNDNITWNAAETYVASKAWPLTTGDGTKTVYVKYKDGAGNWSAVISDTIQLATYDITVLGVSTVTSANITVPISVVTSLKNQGGSASPTFKVGIYLSSDAAITTSDTLIGYGTVSAIPANTQGTLITSVRIPSNLAAGTYYVGAIGDYDNLVTETNETNNALVGNQITITAVAPDLTPTPVSGPAGANITEWVTVSPAVKNQGGTTGGFYVSVYLSADTLITASDTLLGYTFVNSLAAGAQTTLNISGRIPTNIAAGTYYIGVITDDGNNVVEANEANNTLVGNQIAITAVAPDLTPTAVSGSASGNITQPVTIATTVKNQGGTTGGFYVNIYLSTDAVITAGDTRLGYASVNSLAAGAQATLNITERIPATALAGTYYIGVLVDDGNNVAEVNEANNTLSGNQITITASKPDLTITAASGPATGTRGQPISVNSTLKNQGGTTGGFYVSFYLSPDPAITSSDTFLGFSYIGAFASGASSTIGGSIAIPAGLAPGVYYIGSIADDGDYVAESIETNNSLAGNQITIN